MMKTDVPQQTSTLHTVAPLPRLFHALGAELRALAAALAAPWLHALLAALALVFLLVPQLPLRYTIEVGYEEGYGSDLPYLQDFNTAEVDASGSYRWTAGQSAVWLPGVGARPLLLELNFTPVGPAAMAAGPQAIDLWSAEQRLAALPVSPEGRRYMLALPARLQRGGAMHLTLRSSTFTPPDDPRQLGTPVDRMKVASFAGLWLAAPDWGAAGAWLLAGALVWATLARVLDTPPHARPAGARAARRATPWMVGAVMLAALAALLDPPRWAFGAWPALVAAALCYPLALALCQALPAIARRLDIPLAPRALGWLVMICVIAFGMRHGGRLYPGAMHGDIGFHVNRYNDTVKGTIFIVSDNRGIKFPYPPGPYLLVAPLTLPGLATSTVLQAGAALADALGAAMVYTIAVRGLQRFAGYRLQVAGWSDTTRAASNLQPATNVGLLAAAIYVFTPAGLMTTWWSFDTHIYSQFLALLVVAALVYWGSAPRARGAGQEESPGRALPPQPFAMRAAPVACVVLLLLVFLGHFGFFINTTLLAAMLGAALWLGAARGNAWARALRWPFTLAYAAALIFALGFFYSAYAQIMIDQARVAAAGGLSAVAERQPVERAYLWRILWQVGIIAHFGFFPLPLAILSIWALPWPAQRPAGGCRTGAVCALRWVMAGSFVVSVLFAGVPFLTLATNSTRWLMFSAWAVAVGSAAAAHGLWRCGGAGRAAVAAMGGFVLWNTALIWLGPMLWRIRPPEPF